MDGRRTSTGKVPRLEKGRYCRVCGFRLAIEKRDRGVASKRAWVTRRERYGYSGARYVAEVDEFFS